MKTILLTLISFFTFLSIAQNPPILWQKNIGGGGSDDLTKIEIPNSTDYFLVGDSDSNISGDKTENSRGLNDLWILRLDQNNTILWDKTIGGSSFDYYISSLVKNDTLFVMSFSNSPISGEKTIVPLNTDGSSDIWFLALDLSGNILWQKLYGGTEDDGGQHGSIIELPNNNLLFGVNSRSGISGNKTEANIGFDDFWLVEISSTDGSIVNQNAIGTTGVDNIAQLFLSPNNSIMITGKADQGVSGDKTDPGYGNTDVWLVDVDMNLNVLQDKCFGGSGSEYNSGGIINYIDDYYYLMCSSSSSISGNKTAPYMGDSGSGLHSDYWLIKMDTNFNIIWDKTYGGIVNDYGGGVLKLDFNKLLLKGFSNSVVSGNKTSPKYGSYDTWLLIIDTLGNIIAQETYGGSLDDYVTPTPTLTNGVFYMSGGSNSGISGNKTVPTNGGSDAWLMEIDASGFLNTETIEGVNTTISVYPNPSNGLVNFKFNDLEEDVVVTFYTVDGRIIMEDNIQTATIKTEYNFSGENQMVFYHVKGQKVNYSGKVVLQ